MQQTARTGTVSDVLARGLRRHGVRAIFGQSIPTALMLAAARAGIRQIAYRTENAGGAMADAYARVSGQVGVVAAQNGPAATLLVAPLAEAAKASVPILTLVQDVPARSRDRNAFQEFDHFALFGSCTKWVRRLDDPSRAADYLDLAVVAATSGRPGPAVLLLPSDVLLEPGCDDSGRHETLGAYPLDRLRPDAGRVAEAAKLIAEARLPLIIAGGGVHLSGATAQLSELQEVVSVPVATTNMGKGAVDELHPLSLGVIGNYMGQRSYTGPLRQVVDEADVILLVGTRTNENGTDGWRLFPADATYIHLDIDGMEIGRNYESLRLAGDAKLGLADLVDALKNVDLQGRTAARSGIERRIDGGRIQFLDQVEKDDDSSRSPIRPQHVACELDRIIDEDSIIVGDASYSTIWVGNYLRARKSGQRFLTPRGLAGLGWGLPMALGAQVAAPDATVVCLTGDGGFGHVWSELETAVREGLPVTIVVLNNGILGYQKHGELINLGAHSTAVDLGPVDHAEVARACGTRGVRLTDPLRVTATLEQALSEPGPVLVDVITDPDAYPPITGWDDDAESAILTGNPPDLRLAP